MSTDFDDSQFDIDGRQKDNCLAIFHTHAVQNKQKSEEEGRPIFEDKVYIKIIVPGSKDEVDRLARDEDKVRFAGRWAAFQQKLDAPVTGTPMLIWHEVGPSQAAEMAALNVTTVDQLALLSDDAIQRLGPGYIDLRKKAQDFITMRDRAKSVEGLRGRVKELEAEVLDLRGQIAAQSPTSGLGDKPPTKRRVRATKGASDAL